MEEGFVGKFTVDDERLRVGEGSPSGGVHSGARVIALEGAADVLQEQFAGVHVAKVVVVDVVVVVVAGGVARAVGQLFEQRPVQEPSSLTPPNGEISMEFIQGGRVERLPSDAQEEGGASVHDVTGQSHVGMLQFVDRERGQHRQSHIGFICNKKMLDLD